MQKCDQKQITDRELLVDKRTDWVADRFWLAENSCCESDIEMAVIATLVLVG